VQVLDRYLTPLSPALEASLDFVHPFKRTPDVAIAQRAIGAVVWNSYEQDGSIDGVFARLYRLSSLTAATAVPDLTPGGLLTLISMLAIAGVVCLRRR
jgi:hypothetical protein